MGLYHIGNFIKRTFCVLLTCLVLLGLFLPPTFAQETGEEEVFDLIMEVKRDRKTLSTAIFGLEKNGKYYIPLRELARIVQFNTEIDLDRGLAKGFFLTQENTYSINVSEATYTLKGESNSFDPSEALVYQQKFGIGDIYVTVDLLNKIWPLQLSFNNLMQVLEIQTPRKLPYQTVVERQLKRNNRLARKEENEPDIVSGLPVIENDYKLFSLPALDFTTSTRLENAKGTIGQSLNISGRNDLLNAQASYNLSFDREPGQAVDFENARFLLERQSFVDGDLPAGLKLMQAGDIRPLPSRLIDGSLIGRGVLISTEPQKQIVDFDQITVEGTADPGWEVELYRGDELIDFQIVNEQGEYRFEDVTLNYSNTPIRTVLYGPEGQIQEEEQVYNISNAMLQPGKNVFEASILDLNRDLILSVNQPKNQPEGVAQNYKVKRGITSWLSAFSTFTDTPGEDKRHRYATLGVNLSLFGISGLIEGYRDTGGGSAIDFRAAGNFAGVNLNLRNALLSNFESEEARYGDAARTSRTEFNASRSFQLPFGNLGFRLNVDHEKFKNNDPRTNYDFSQTFAAKGLRITHGNSTQLLNRHHQLTDGRINASYTINPNWQLRSLLDYDLYPHKSFNTVQAELRYRDRDKFTAAATINRNLQDQSTRLGGDVSYDFEKFRTGFNLDWDKDSGFRAFLRATFSMAPYGKNGEYIFSSKNLSNKSAMHGRIFLDKDYDGIYGPEDEFIEEAKLDVGRRESDPSGEDGYASYLGSPRDEYENVTLNQDSLADPYMVSTVPGYSALLRPATMSKMDFPVIQTGIIDGTVYADDGPLAGATIQLLENNEVIDSTPTAFDGYYAFEYINPGIYTVRIDPAYEQVHVPPRSVSVTPEKLSHYGIDFQITEQAEGAACVETPETGENGRVTQNCQTSSTHCGIGQPAHTCKSMVEYVRLGKYKDRIRMTLDLSAPTDFNIIEAKGNKELTIQLPMTGWLAEKSWNNPEAEILKGLLIEELPTGGTKIIVKAVKTIRVSKSGAQEPDGEKGHRLYFELKK